MTTSSPFAMKIENVLDGQLSSHHKHVRELNKENMNKLQAKYTDLLKLSKMGGGKRGVERHVVRNKKMLARDRVKLLLDEGSPQLEISSLAGLNLEYGTIPCGGVVTVIGQVHGVWCMICANDATVKGGSLYPVTVKKQLRVQQIAEENHLPVIYLVDSGGAYLPLQAQIFNEGGRAFYNQAIMSSKGISQIALVCGSCTAGAAYIPTMADEAVILHKTGTIFLGGPPLVFAATGERVTSEQLGGATLHCETSGCTDHFATSEEEAITKTRDIVATLNIDHELLDARNTSNRRRATKEELPAYDEGEMNELAPAEHRFHQLDVKLMLARIVDGSRMHEFKAAFARSLVTGFARVGGHLAGFVAGNGQMTGQACLKATHFVQLCSQRGIPIVYLQHFEGRLEEPDQCELNDCTVKNRAQLLQAVSCARVPSVTISYGGVTGHPHSHLLGSLSTGSRFHFIFPNVSVGLSDPQTLAELEAASRDDGADAATTLDLFHKYKRQTCAFKSAASIVHDDVILPRDARSTIVTCLAIFKQAEVVEQSQSGQQQQTMFRM